MSCSPRCLKKTVVGVITGLLVYFFIAALVTLIRFTDGALDFFRMVKPSVPIIPRFFVAYEISAFANGRQWI